MDATAHSLRRTILVADDDDHSRQLVVAALANEGFALVEAHNGDEAWKYLIEFRPDVAILDIEMPGRNGLQLTEAIEQSAQLRSTQVILLTASHDDARAGLEAGARLYLTKPFSPLELRRLVRRMWVMG
ncbi:MAG TPA: response regulator [Chloroflexota bacterium]